MEKPNIFWQPRENFGVGYTPACFTKLGLFCVITLTLTTIVGGSFLLHTNN